MAYDAQFYVAMSSFSLFSSDFVTDDQMGRVGERTSSSAEKRNIKKQRRFWATHVIRKWTFRIYSNFRKNRLYNLDKNYDT